MKRPRLASVLTCLGLWITCLGLCPSCVTDQRREVQSHPEIPAHRQSGARNEAPPVRPQPPAFDQSAELDALEHAVNQDGHVRVMIEIELETALPAGPLSAEEKKVQGATMQARQRDVLAALGRRPDGRGVREIVGLPFVALDIGAAEIALFRRAQTRAGELVLEVEGRSVSVRVQRSHTLEAQGSAVGYREPIGQILERIGVEPSSPLGVGTLVVVIDSAVQPQADIFEGRLVAPPAIAGVLPLPTVTLPKTTHGTKVASVVAAAAPGCEIVPWNLSSDDRGSISVDAIAGALAQIYNASEPDFLPRVAAVVISRAQARVTLVAPCTLESEMSVTTKALHLAIGYLASSEVAVVVPAGNVQYEVGCGEVLAPWCMPAVITVASTDGRSPSRSDFSFWSDMVDLAAPGGRVEVNIVSGRGASSLNGTSIAVPMVAAMYARMAEAQPSSTLEQRTRALIECGRLIDACDHELPEIRLDAALRHLATGSCSPPQSVATR